MLFAIILTLFIILLFFFVIGTYVLGKPEDPLGSIKNVIDHTTKAWKGTEWHNF